MRKVDINSGGLQRGPVRGAEAGGGGHRTGADNGSVCPSKVFCLGREGRVGLAEIYLGGARWDRQIAFIFFLIVRVPLLRLHSQPCRLPVCAEDVLRSHFCYMVLPFLC